MDLTFERTGNEYAGWNVITGENASGKTTFLKALSAVLVGPDALRSLQPSLRGWIREGCSEAYIAAQFVAGREGEDGFTVGRPPVKPFWAALRLSANGGPDVSLGRATKYGGKQTGPTHGPWAENPRGWFSAGYGPFRRLYGASPDAQRIMSGPGRIARYATMFREDATLGECELWLKELHHRSLERPHSREERILGRVTELLNSDFLQHNVTVQRVDSAGLWLRHADGMVLPLADMSEGYRAALAMLTDVLRHLTDVYPIGDADTDDMFRHSGVVLIDEVDSHLHPAWQRLFGFWLKQHLPGIQFIVTTHSALICQAADENAIYHLPPPDSLAEPFQIQGREYQNIIREQPNEIYLSPAFNLRQTRSPRAVAERARYAELRAKERAASVSDHERQELKQLEFWADSSNGDTPACAS